MKYVKLLALTNKPTKFAKQVLDHSWKTAIVKFLNHIQGKKEIYQVNYQSIYVIAVTSFNLKKEHKS